MTTILDTLVKAVEPKVKPVAPAAPVDTTAWFTGK
jgi:hypothetical protein